MAKAQLENSIKIRFIFYASFQAFNPSKKVKLLLSKSNTLDHLSIFSSSVFSMENSEILIFIKSQASWRKHCRYDNGKYP